MNIDEVLKKIQAASHTEKKEKLHTFVDETHRANMQATNERIREINTAYTLSAQNAWKYSVQ